MIAALVLRAIPLTHDVVWQLWVARQMLGGTKLYVDVWEVNPPLWFWSAMPVQMLADGLHVPARQVLVVLVVGLGAVSAWLVGHLGRQSGPPERLLAMLVTFWLVVIAPLFDFAQREHLALICAVPYAALVARRSWQPPSQPPSCAMAMLVGAMAAYGFALKHYFVAIPIMLEAWLLLRHRAQWRMLRPETVMLAGAALVYAACVVVITPAFFTNILPMLRVAYHGYESPWIRVAIAPWTLFWAIAAAWFMLYAKALLRDVDPFVVTLLLTASGFVLAYIVQAKAWNYHALPVNAALPLAVAFALASVPNRLVMARFLGLGIVGLAMAVPLISGPYHNTLRAEVDPILATVPPGEPVQVLAADPMWAWPAVEDHHLSWHSRLYTYWMIPAIAHAQTDGPVPEGLRTLARRILDEAWLDMRCAPPAVIVFERRSLYALQPVSFDERAFFLAEPKIRAFVADHYQELGPTPSLYAYRRVHPVSPLAHVACPPGQ